MATNEKQPSQAHTKTRTGLKGIKIDNKKKRALISELVDGNVYDTSGIIKSETSLSKFSELIRLHLLFCSCPDDAFDGYANPEERESISNEYADKVLGRVLKKAADVLEVAEEDLVNRYKEEKLSEKEVYTIVGLLGAADSENNVSESAFYLAYGLLRTRRTEHIEAGSLKASSGINIPQTATIYFFSVHDEFQSPMQRTTREDFEADYGEELYEMLDKFESFYESNSKKIKTSEQLLKEFAKSEHTEYKLQTEFYRYGTSPATHLIYESYNASKIPRGGKDIYEGIGSLPARKKDVSHGEKITVSGYKAPQANDITTNGVRVLSEKGNSIVEISIEDMDKLVKARIPSKKFFMFALMKLNEQAVKEGKLTRNFIHFDLQECVDCGMYKDVTAARRGFKAAADILTSTKVKVSKKSKTSSSEATVVLFKASKIDNAQCMLYPNDLINWSVITTYFTILPKYCFSLSSRGFDLSYGIFYRARQCVANIASNGYFDMSLKLIQVLLNLPSEVGNTDPTRTIKDEIENAVCDILDNHAHYYNNNDLRLELVYPENAKISEYLNNGYLRVYLSGTHAEAFIELDKQTKKKIKAAAEKKARIDERARALVLAKTLPEPNKAEEKQAPETA